MPLSGIELGCLRATAATLLFSHKERIPSRRRGIELIVKICVLESTVEYYLSSHLCMLQNIDHFFVEKANEPY